jgi:hypothetical protein
MTDAGWYSQHVSLNSLYLVKFYICKLKSTGRGSLIKKQTIGTIGSIKSRFIPIIFLLQMPSSFDKGSFDWNFALNKYSLPVYLHSFPTTYNT